MNQPAKKSLNDRFVDIADWVSEAMGTPTNIILWLIAVLVWFLIFALNPNLQNSSFLPTWFTSNSFNFPLNSVTTLAELWIGFLVAAAANRVEKRNRLLQEQQAKIIRHIDIIIKHVEKTASQEEQEVADAEKRLTEQNTKLMALAQHLDTQDQELIKQTQLLTDLVGKIGEGHQEMTRQTAMLNVALTPKRKPMRQEARDD